MIIYRLAVDKYKEDLSGNGSKIFGGRWNTKGISALYTTENVSLSVLEILVNTSDKKNIPPSYHLLTIEIPNTIVAINIAREKLKKNWKDDFEYTQFMGSEFLKQNKSLLLKVPSAVVDLEYNYLINPLHIDLKKIKIKSIAKFKFDSRLYLNNE